MKRRIYEEWEFLLPCIFVFSFPIVAFADATDSSVGHHGAESSVKVDYFSLNNCS